MGGVNLNGVETTLPGPASPLPKRPDDPPYIFFIHFARGSEHDLFFYR